MTSKLLATSFGGLLLSTFTFIILSLFLIDLFSDDLFIFLFLLSTSIGILAPFVFSYSRYKVVAWGIFIIASIINFIWFFITRFPFVLYFLICHLCFMFIYGLFFIQLPLYALKYQERFEQSSIKGYHLHENFYGIVMIFIGSTTLFGYRWLPPFNELFTFLMSHLLTYFGIFSIILGGFLIGRDYQDVLKFKFIEKIQTRKLDPTFNIRTTFYHTSPFSIILILFGINFIVAPELMEIFLSLNFDQSKFIGLLIILIGSILSGLNPTYFANKTRR
ncbi:MAG: hypothetical protein ACTSRS_20480 [Candidatus Helarchaeota archaeon]